MTSNMAGIIVKTGVFLLNLDQEVDVSISSYKSVLYGQYNTYVQKKHIEHWKVNCKGRGIEEAI